MRRDENRFHCEYLPTIRLRRYMRFKFVLWYVCIYIYLFTCIYTILFVYK